MASDDPPDDSSLRGGGGVLSHAFSWPQRIPTALSVNAGAPRRDGRQRRADCGRGKGSRMRGGVDPIGPRGGDSILRIKYTKRQTFCTVG